MDLIKTIEDEMEEVMRQISSAANRQDFNVLEHMTKKASELKAMKDQIMAIQNRLAHFIRNPVAEGLTKQVPCLIREFGIEVTQGMINQNLLTLSDHVKRGLIRVGEKLVITARPSGDCFETELLANGNKLQERGKIGKFYRDASVLAGNLVSLSELTPGQWELKKAETIRYKRI